VFGNYDAETALGRYTSLQGVNLPRVKISKRLNLAMEGVHDTLSSVAQIVPNH
jgi:hypothetical protein